jgi:hypothetical protein
LLHLRGRDTQGTKQLVRPCRSETFADKKQNIIITEAQLEKLLEKLKK